MSLLARHRAITPISTPFPHVVIENVLDPALAEQLTTQMPSLDFFTGGKRIGDCTKRYYAGAKALRDPAISETWKTFIRDNSDQALFDDLLAIFGTALAQRWPALERDFGRPADWRVGVRYQDDREDRDALLECQFSMHTPVAGAASAADRGPHVKTTDKLFVGHLFLRQPDDPADGGGLELFSVRSGAQPRFGRDNVTDRAHLRLDKTIPFRNNTLILWLNGPEAIQGFAPRTPGPIPMTYGHVLLELPRAFFSLPRTPLTRARNLLGRLRYGLGPPRQQIERFGQG